MVALKAKKTESIALGQKLRSYAEQNYPPPDIEQCNEDFNRVEEMRNSAVVSSQGGFDERSRALAKYYQALCLVESRFPISENKSHAQISFTWYDSFRPSKKAQKMSIHLEKAAVLFNLAALHSQQTEVSESGMGLKEKSHHAQIAAGILKFMAEHESGKIDSPTVDVSLECADMLANLHLAFAQECFYRKAEEDGKSKTTSARLASDAATLYSHAGKAVQSSSMSAHFGRNWNAELALREGLMNAHTLRNLALAVAGDEQIGERIARLQAAYDSLRVALKQAKGADTSDNLANEAQGLQNTLSSELSKARKENEVIYMERIPQHESLPLPKAARMVSANFSDANLNELEETLFKSIVPDTSAKALSRYTDMVDTKTRKQLEQVEELSDEARLKLAELELPDLLNYIEGGERRLHLPDAIQQEVDEFHRANGVAGLKQMVKTVEKRSKLVSDVLQDAAKALENEERADQEAREQFGDRFDRTPSASASASLKNELSRYRDTLNEARKSDELVQSKLRSSEDVLATLAYEELAKNEPRLEAPLVSTSNVDDVVGEVKACLAKLQELSEERAKIEQSIREEKGSDDILPKLMRTNKSPDDLFEKEIKKFDQFQEEINSNKEEQNKVLQRLKSAHAEFARAYNVDEWRGKYSAFIEDVRDVLSTYRDILSGVQEGMNFYESMQDSARQLSSKIHEHCNSRMAEKDRLVNKLGKEGGEGNSQRVRKEYEEAMARYREQLQHYNEQLEQHRLQAQQQLSGLSIGHGNIGNSYPASAPPQD